MRSTGVATFALIAGPTAAGRLALLRCGRRRTLDGDSGAWAKVIAIRTKQPTMIHKRLIEKIFDRILNTIFKVQSFSRRAGSEQFDHKAKRAKMKPGAR